MDVTWPSGGVALHRRREHTTGRARRRTLARRHKMHHPTPEGVPVDPLDREPVQVEQTRPVRLHLTVNMLNLRTLDQARDLAS